MYSRLLKIILVVATFGWGISVLGVLLPWSVATVGMSGLGAGPLPGDPMLDYWLRMAGGGFTMIGAIFAAILINPRKYAVLLPLMAWLCIAEGVILLVSGLRLGLPAFPFWGDVSFCLGVGGGILVVYPRATMEQAQDSHRKPGRGKGQAI
jgi:hypothetical protein